MSRWSKAATSRMVRSRSMPLPNTSPDMSPTPATVNGVRPMSTSDLAEMPLDRFPGAARRDPHLLVVVADGAAGREGIAEPEPVLVRDRIGDVGKGRGPLVGGDDQIRIVALVAHHIGGRDQAGVAEIVGDVEQRRHEQP